MRHPKWGMAFGLLLAAIALISGCEDDIRKANEREQQRMERARQHYSGESGPADAATAEEKPCLHSFFTQSLHYTGEGMRYWYEEEGGFMNITGIPYADLDCKTCHVRTCDHCHAQKQKDGSMVLSQDKVRDMETCLTCHSREGLTFKYDRAKNQTDVHIAAGMVCADCHYGKDVHGDGKFRHSMRDPGGVNVGCESCHHPESETAPVFNPDSPSHSVHGGKLTCQACHVSNTTACMNCHFDRFLETGKRKGNFLPMKDWVMLINHEDKVTSGSAMSLVHEGEKFLAYVPYYTHSVSPTGRQCNECHANEAVQQMANGETVRVMDFENGQVTTRKGVIPVVPELLDFVYLDKAGSEWTPLPEEGEVMVQFAAHGEPLTQSQLESLAQEMSE